jgi:hypothetical protein
MMRDQSFAKAILVLILTLAFPLLSLPPTAAHTPPWNVQTTAHISVSPNPVGVNQMFNATFWLDEAPPTATADGGYRWVGLTVRITKPDGTTETRGPFVSDVAGQANFSYVPSQTGTYTLDFNFPTQVVSAGGSGGVPSEYVNDTFLASTSRTTLTVQQQPVVSSPTPLPTLSPTAQPTNISTPQPTPTPTLQPTPSPTSKPISWCQIGVPYKAPDGLTVTVTNLQLLEKDGSYKYQLNYTLQNNSWDQAITEGNFHMWSLDDSERIEQHGMFERMGPGDVKSRSYQFLSGSQPLYDVLEYHPMSFQVSNNSVLSWKVGDSSGVPEPVNKPTLEVTCRGSTSYSDFRVEITGSLTINGEAFSGVPVLLSYSLNGGISWNDLTRVNTDGNGGFSVVWLPSVTGNNMLKATYAGNSTYASATTIVNFAVTASESQDAFSVTSNSTLSELAFNSTSQELSFSVTGEAGTFGFVNLNIPKTLLDDASQLRLYLDDELLGYSYQSQGNSWAISFTYHHSTHKITLNLNSATSTSLNGGESTQWILYGAAIAAVAIAVAVVVLFRHKKRQ